MVRLASLVFLVFVALALVPSGAGAQPRCAAPASLDDAAALYECGTRALTAEQYADAEAYLARSLERQSSVRAAFNLAIALRNLGRARRALTLLRELEAGRYGEVPGERRDSLARQIETNLASLATVVVTLPAGLARARVEVDGVESQELDGGAEARFVVEPGEHAILASAPGTCMERAVISVSRGQTQAVQLVTTECATEATAGAGPLASEGAGTEDAGSDEGVLIGVGIGVGVAIVAGAIVLGVVLGTSSGGSGCRGEPACTETLVAPLLRF